MPFPNFHAARIREQGKFVRIVQIGTGEDGAIRFIGGPLKTDPGGDAVIQAIRFEKDKYTVAQAKAWLKEHEHSPILFEEAGTEDSADLPLICEGEVLRFDEGLSLRFDETAIAKVQKMDDGSIAGEAVITRSGVFHYRLPDGSIRKELRPPEEVFKADSLASAKMRPITDNHPSEFVNPENAKDLAVGFTGETVRRDGRHVVATVKINTAQGITAVESGRRQLSLGYKCRVDEEAGAFEGEEYTHVQRGIVYNHLALVQRARAGNAASLRLDAADAVMEVEEPGKERNKMGSKVRLDNGIEYDCAAEVAVELERVRKERTDASAERDELKKKLDGVTAERDEFKARAEKAEKVDHSEAITAGIKTRLDILGKARKALDEKEHEKLDAMTDDEIRHAVIKAKHPDLDLAGKSAEYIGARFDAIAETLKDDAAQQNADKVMGDKSKGSSPNDAEKARQDAIDAMTARSRGEAKDK